MLYYGCSSQLLTPLFPHTPRLSVVKHVVKNRFLNTLVTGDRKRFFIVCRSAADGCFVAPVCRIVPLLERLSKSFMQGQAAQNLHRNKQRATAIFFLHFSAVFGGFLSILIPFLTSCDLSFPCVPHLSVAFYVVKGKASPEQFRRGFAVFSAACFSTR